MMDHERLRAGLKHLLQLSMSERAYARGAELWRRFERIFVRYIQCELLDALIVGVARMDSVEKRGFNSNRNAADF